MAVKVDIADGLGALTDYDFRPEASDKFAAPLALSGVTTRARTLHSRLSGRLSFTALGRS